MELSEREFKEIAEIMYQETGIHLKSSKMNLILNRLNERLAGLGLQSYTQYINLLKAKNKSEIEKFINQLTTNETFFFRHTTQFNYLFEHILPELLRSRGSSKKIKIWSAACSTGEEPYSLAITCKNFLLSQPSWKIDIFASDINTEVLAEATRGVYEERSLRETPESLVSKYFKLSKKETAIEPAQFTVSSDIKKMVTFFSHNLKEKLINRGMFDIIFLRNALIYFDEISKKQVIEHMVNSLLPDSYIIIGLSESLNEFGSLRFIESGIYKKI